MEDGVPFVVTEGLKPFEDDEARRVVGGVKVELVSAEGATSSTVVTLAADTSVDR